MSGLLSHEYYEVFSVEHPVTHVMYGLCKIHKNIKDPSIRPIVSSQGWLTEPLSIYVEKHVMPPLDEVSMVLKDTK